jgi:peroxiredoxin
LPSLERLYLEFKDNPFSIIAIDVGESRETVLKFSEENDLSFTVLLNEDSQISAQYAVRSHPMKFLIDRQGNLIGVSQGYKEWDAAEMKSLIKALIN